MLVVCDVFRECPVIYYVTTSDVDVAQNRRRNSDIKVTMYLPNSSLVTMVTLILLSVMAPAHSDTDVKRDNTEGIGNGAEQREKRVIKTIGTKLGQLGLQATRYFHHLLHERTAKKTLLADANYETTAYAREYTLHSYRKGGGCARALKDFRLMEAAGVKIVNGVCFEGQVGSKPVSFNGNYQKTHGCEIKFGYGRVHGGIISVKYPEKAKFQGFS